MSDSSSSRSGYLPSKPAAICGALLFSVAATGHVSMFIQHRAWFFWAMALGVCMEAVGHIARAIWANNLRSVWAFLINYLFIILAPSFIAAACYVTFGRLVWYITPQPHRNSKHLWVPPRLITPIFVAFDLFAFLVQFLGVATVASAYNDSQKGEDLSGNADKTARGKKILKVGLVAQLLCFCIFALVSVRFLVICKKWRHSSHAHGWMPLSWAVNAVAVLVTLRGLYRVFEFSGDRENKNYFETHEWTFWVFDALFVLISSVTFIAVHPSKYLPYSFTRFRLDKRGLGLMTQYPTQSPPAYDISPLR